MTEKEFLRQLYEALQTLSPGEREDILSDFREHFAVGAESGKSEEQICSELGSPGACAAQYVRQAQAAYSGGTRGNPQRNRFLWGVLFFVLVALAFGVYPVSAGLMLSLLVILIATAAAATLTSSFTAFGFLISLGVFLFSLGLLLFLLMTWALRLAWRRAEL